MSKQYKSTSPDDKSVSKTKKTASPQRNLKETVGFIYGGELMKVNRVIMFGCNDDDVIGYVKKTFVKMFGSAISGRYVKCENAEKALKDIFENVMEHKEESKDKPRQCTLIEDDCNLLKSSVDAASKLIKKMANSDVAHTIKLTDAKKTVKPKGKEPKDLKDKDAIGKKKPAGKATKSKKDEGGDVQSDSDAQAQARAQAQSESDSSDDEKDVKDQKSKKKPMERISKSKKEDEKSDESDAESSEADSDPSEEEEEDADDDDDISDKETDKSRKDVKNKKTVSKEIHNVPSIVRKGGNKKIENKPNRCTGKGKKGNGTEEPK